MQSSLKMWKTECENGQIFYQECLICQQEKTTRILERKTKLKVVKRCNNTILELK